jgi:hypothetical protein
MCIRPACLCMANRYFTTQRIRKRARGGATGRCGCVVREENYLCQKNRIQIGSGFGEHTAFLNNFDLLSDNKPFHRLLVTDSLICRRLK